MNYEIIVVGAGHAGCEAAYASSKKGHKTALITINLKNIADMPCNPSIGGSAKGIIVREIDAIGGIMGLIADKSHFQIKLLRPFKTISPNPTPCVSVRILLIFDGELSDIRLTEPPPPQTRRPPLVGCSQSLSPYTPSYTQPLTSSPVPLGTCCESQTRH